MGYALAQAAKMAGCEVVLISGKTTLPIPDGVSYQEVDAHQDMYDAVMATIRPDDIFISCAAIADFSPKMPLTHKMKKEEHSNYVLALKKNADILSEVAALGKAAYLVGFAAETQNLIDNAFKKLSAKKVDMIIANEVGFGKGFDTEENTVTVITKNETLVIDSKHKMRVAADIICLIAKIIHEQ